MTVIPFTRKRVGVFPRSVFEAETRLLRTLAELYPVDFSPEGEIGFNRMDAAVFSCEQSELAERAFEHGISSFVFRKSGSRRELPANATVKFSGNTVLHPAFRNAQIPLGCPIKAAELNAEDGDTILTVNSLRFWVFRSDAKAELHTVGTELPSVDSMLWENLRPDGWLAPVPLLHFIRRVSADVDWLPTPQRACFIFDDPNLHTARYGYLDYVTLAAHARVHNYHVAIATVPLDAWYAGRKAVEVFRRHRERLSLLIHGNDHTRNELGCDYSDTDAVRMLAQALRRVVQFERRTGLGIERVIAPPHGGCSESVLAQAPRVGIEALCTSAEPLARCLNRTSLPLGFGLLPVWFGPGCCPVIRRWDLVYGLMPLRLAAFLGQPLVSYGHHQDCAEGFGPMAEVASVVNTWGQTRWTNLEAILRGNYRTMMDNELMHVQMCSRSVNVIIPENISHVVVHAPMEDQNVRRLKCISSSASQTQTSTVGVPFCVAGYGILQLRIAARDSVDPASVSPPEYRVWSPIRRALSIGRDRLMPLMRTLQRSRAVDFRMQQS